MQWTHHYSTYFADNRLPAVVRYEMEQRLRLPLQVETGAQPLVYAESYGPDYNGITGRLELRFDAPSIYSLHFEAARQCDFMGHLPPKPGSKFAEVGILDEPAFLRDSEKLFQAWTEDLAVLGRPGTLRHDTIYQQLVRNAIEADARQASQAEDPRAIGDTQQAVLDALRAGKSYRNANKEGLICVQMEGSALVRRETGEQESVDRFSSRDNMLVFLRQYFDYEARRDTIPHKPTEEAIWRFILSQFQ